MFPCRETNRMLIECKILLLTTNCVSLWYPILYTYFHKSVVICYLFEFSGTTVIVFYPPGLDKYGVLGENIKLTKFLTVGSPTSRFE